MFSKSRVQNLDLKGLISAQLIKHQIIRSERFWYRQIAVLLKCVWGDLCLPGALARQNLQKGLFRKEYLLKSTVKILFLSWTTVKTAAARLDGRKLEKFSFFFNRAQGQGGGLNKSQSLKLEILGQEIAAPDAKSKTYPGGLKQSFRKVFAVKNKLDRLIWHVLNLVSSLSRLWYVTERGRFFSFSRWINIPSSVDRRIAVCIRCRVDSFKCSSILQIPHFEKDFIH